MRLALIAMMVSVMVLSGCTTTRQAPPLVVQKNVVVDVPPELFRCVRPNFPDPETLTDVQVARLLANLDAALRRCGANLTTVEQILSAARSEIEKKQRP